MSATPLARNVGGSSVAWLAIAAVVIAAGAWRVGQAEAAADKATIEYVPPELADGFMVTFSPGADTTTYYTILLRDADDLTITVNGKPAYHTDNTQGQFLVPIPNQTAPETTMAISAKAGAVVAITRITYGTKAGAVLTGAAVLDQTLLDILEASGVNAVAETKRKPKKPTLSAPAYAGALLMCPGIRAVRWHTEDEGWFEKTLDDIVEIYFRVVGITMSIATMNPLPMIVAMAGEDLAKDLVDNAFPQDAIPDVDEVLIGWDPQEALKVGGIGRAMRDVSERRANGRNAVAFWQRPGVTTGPSNMAPRVAGETVYAPWWKPNGQTETVGPGVRNVLAKLALNPVGTDYAGGTATYLPDVTLAGNAEQDLHEVIQAMRDRLRPSFSVSGANPAAFRATLTRAFADSGGAHLTIPTVSVGETGYASWSVRWINRDGKVVQTDGGGPTDGISTFVPSSFSKDKFVLPFITLDYGDEAAGIAGPTIKVIGQATYVNALAYPVKGSASDPAGTLLVDGLGIPGVNTAEFGSTRTPTPRHGKMFRIVNKKTKMEHISDDDDPDNDDGTAEDEEEGEEGEDSDSDDADSGDTPASTSQNGGKDLVLIGKHVIASSPIWYVYGLPKGIADYDVSVRLDTLKRIGKNGYAGAALTGDPADYRKRLVFAVARDPKDAKKRLVRMVLTYPTFTKQPDVAEILCETPLASGSNGLKVGGKVEDVTLTLKVRQAPNGTRFIGLANGTSVCDVTYTKTASPLAFREAGVEQRNVRAQYSNFTVVKRNAGDP